MFLARQRQKQEQSLAAPNWAAASSKSCQTTKKLSRNWPKIHSGHGNRRRLCCISLSHLIGGPPPESHRHHAVCADAPNLDLFVLRLGQRTRVVLPRQSKAKSTQVRTHQAGHTRAKESALKARQLETCLEALALATFRGRLNIAGRGTLHPLDFPLHGKPAGIARTHVYMVKQCSGSRYHELNET